ncbi:hypothetical protein [Citreimonas salinaria]|uniref:Uncharacterized protein n=1 Tax=Citreimonas salinaria TaxID=321339 RepID=A0A1H3MGL7_9RHOB|nr:hypothetical protein [Citreimonas salinaria]SDY75830.1 hypothetical protein SAMN05444340_11717 [Citreimonas salinaria]
MTALSTRVRRLESRRPEGDDPVEILLVNFCERAEDGTLVTRPGFARFVGWDIPEMHPEEGESKEAFGARADAALAEAKAGRTTT